MKKIEAIKIVIDRESGEIIATMNLTASACQVTGEIIDDEFTNIGCRSVSCDGECNLQTREEGTKTHYWCTCD